MGIDQIPPRIWFFLVLAFAITVLLGRAVGMSLLHNYREGAMWLGVALLLVALFFRRRVFALLLSVLVFIIVNVGMTLPFHPSLGGVGIGIVAVVVLLAMCRWHVRRYPDLRARDWQKIFDNDSPF